MENNCYDIRVLRQGSITESEDGSYKLRSSICLLTGSKNILINTGGAWELEVLNLLLNNSGCSTKTIDYVVCTNNKSDNIGNLNLFQNATHIVGHDIQKNKSFLNHKFCNEIPFEIDRNVSVVPTPGRCMTDLSVIIDNGPDNITAIVGDMIFCEEEIQNHFEFHNWPIWSMDELIKNRRDIMQRAHRIIPGRGKEFLVREDHYILPIIHYNN